jgi:hypothetical protein
VQLDDTPPDGPTVIGGSDSWQCPQTNLAIQGLSADPGGSGVATEQYEISTDGGTTWGSATSGSSDPILNEGSYEFRFRAEDHAGNWSDWSTPDAGATWMEDCTPPTAPTATGGGDPSAYQNGVYIIESWDDSTDALSGVVTYQHDIIGPGGADSGWVDGDVVNISDEGPHMVYFRAIDNAGNISQPSTAYYANVDSTPPVASAPTVVESGPCDSSATIYFVNYSDPGQYASGVDESSVVYETSTDGSNWGSPTALGGGGVYWLNVNGSGLTGTWYIRYTVTDYAGNVSDWSSPASVCIS